MIRSTGAHLVYRDSRGELEPIYTGLATFLQWWVVVSEAVAVTTNSLGLSGSFDARPVFGLAYPGPLGRGCFRTGPTEHSPTDVYESFDDKPLGQIGSWR